MLEDRDLVKIVKWQLQALKASCPLEVGCAAEGWELLWCERLSLMYPAPKIHTSGHQHHVCMQVDAHQLKQSSNRGTRKLSQTTLQIQGEPLFLTGHLDPHDSGKDTPNN